MKKIAVLLSLVISVGAFSQKEKTKIYNPDIDAMEQLNVTIEQAGKEGKHILAQVGGNWCSWCIKLHNFVADNPKLDSIISADYLFVKVNYSKENKNWDALKKLGYPQRFGFPVIVVLDENGNRIHTQDTGYLEENKGYSSKKIERFLLSWNKKAIDPDTYSKK